MFQNVVLKNEIMEIQKHYEIKSIFYFSDKDAYNLSLAYSGLLYCKNIGMTNILPKVQFIFLLKSMQYMSLMRMQNLGQFRSCRIYLLVIKGQIGITKFKYYIYNIILHENQACTSALLALVPYFRYCVAFPPFFTMTKYLN